ncbi:MAG: universal stress protein [Halobacteriales archaeon]
MYERILIPTDGSKDATKGTEHGIDLAAAVDAQVHSIYVIEEGGNPWKPDPMDDQMDEAEAYAQGILDEVADQAAAAGVDSVTDVLQSPSVHKAINEYVEEEDVDLIVMGSGYYGKFGGLLGSTAEKVLRSATVPVTTIRRGD